MFWVNGVEWATHNFQQKKSLVWIPVWGLCGDCLSSQSLFTIHTHSHTDDSASGAVLGSVSCPKDTWEAAAGLDQTTDLLICGWSWCTCKGFLWELQFLPTVQKHAWLGRLETLKLPRGLVTRPLHYVCRRLAPTAPSYKAGNIIEWLMNGTNWVKTSDLRLGLKQCWG